MWLQAKQVIKYIVQQILDKETVNPSLLFNSMSAVVCGCILVLVSSCQGPAPSQARGAGHFLPLSTCLHWVLSKALLFVLLSQMPSEAFELNSVLHTIIKSSSQAICNTFSLSSRKSLL